MRKKRPFLRLFLHIYAVFCINIQCDGGCFLMKNVEKRYFEHNIFHIEHRKVAIHLMGF